MRSGMSPTVVKGATSCFRGVCIAFGCLGEFHSGLMLDDVEDLIDQEVQGVKVMKSSVFVVVVEGASSLGLGARCLLARFLELSAEGSRDHHVKRSLWSASCLS